MRLEEEMQMEFFPKLRQKLAQQFQPARTEISQNYKSQRNFIIKHVIKIKNWIQNIIAFIFTLAFIIPLWMFKTGLNFLDFIEKGIRFIVWLYVKGIILVINFIFKILTFFKITSAVNFFKQIVKNHLGKYSSQTLNKQQEDITKLQIIMNKKQLQLIDIKKVQKKIKTPIIFITHQQFPRLSFVDQQKQQYIQQINQDLVPERTVQDNIVQITHRIKSPKLMGLSQSHLGLKRVATEPNMISSANARLQIQIPLNRQHTSPNYRIQPDRDISPSFYNKQTLNITQASFKKKQSPQKQILLLHHQPIKQGNQAQKQQLQTQLIILRTKMSELINDNNQDINAMQEWIKQKSQTIMMTRKQNLQLLQQIQQLQKQNMKKTKRFAQFEQKIRQMQKMLEKERTVKNGLNQQIQKLEEQIKVKTIEIMSLKQKIRTNFEHLQNMQSIFGNQKIQLEKSPQKQDDLQYMRMNSPEVQQDFGKTLTYDLKQKQPQDLIKQSIVENQSQQEYSHVKTIGQKIHDQQIQDANGPTEVGSEKENIQIQVQDQINETKSIQTSPAEQYIEQSLEQKINQEEQRTDKMVEKVEQKLRHQQQKLKDFENQKSKLIEQLLDRAKQLEDPKLMQQQKPQKCIFGQVEQREQDEKEQQKVEGVVKKKKNRKKKKIQ